VSGLSCPACGAVEGIVVRDTRPQPGGQRRRRVCSCGHRFTTIEVIVDRHPVILERVSLHGCLDAIRIRESDETFKALLADRIAAAVNDVLRL